MNNGHASSRGLIRNVAGIVMLGFVINIRVMNNLEVELWGIRQGLLLAKERVFWPLVVELDVAVVVHFLKTTIIDSHPFYTLVKDFLEHPC